MAMVESSRRSLPGHIAKLPDVEFEEEQEIEEVEPARTDRSPAEIRKNLIDWIENPNIARDIAQDVLDKLGTLVVREYEIDENSRAEWKSEAQSALDFATQKAPSKQYPWEDASNIIFPLITTAALQFNARAYGAIIHGRNVVKGVVWGDDNGTPATQTGSQGAPPQIQDGQPLWLVPPGAKTERAEKIGEHMSWQLLEQMPEWEAQTDQLLTDLPIVGGAVRKTFRDAVNDCNSSVLVPLMKLVWNMKAPSFEKAPRHTEIQTFYPHEIEEFERDDERFLPQLYGPGDAGDIEDAAGEQTATDTSDTSAPHTFLEQHRRYDLDDDGYAEPLTITVHKRSGKVVRIIARYEEEGIISDSKNSEIKRVDPIDSYTLFRFLPNPKGGSYPVGFGHLLKPLNEAVNTTINQMFDAGHLQIAGGGFVGTGLGLHAGNMNFSIGEYKPVNTKGQNIRDSVYQLQWPGPSETLFKLLGFLVGAAKEVSSIQDILTGDASMANASPTTILALIEQGTKIYTAIYKRIYRSMKAELSKLYRLNRIYLTEDQRYRVGDTWRTVTPEDYRLGGGVEPVADPTDVTDAQRLGRASVVVDAAKDSPLVNQLEALRRLFTAAQVDRISDLLPDKMPPPPPNPDLIKAQNEQAKVKIQQQQAETQAQELQFKIAQDSARLGLTRAQEMQAYTTAMLNFEKAKAQASGANLEWIEANLNTLRLHIEALNTSVKAAEVDAKFRGHDVTELGHRLAHHGTMTDIQQRAREAANEKPDSGGPANPSAAGPAGPGIQQPPAPGNGGGGIPGVEAQSGNPGVLPVPGT